MPKTCFESVDHSKVYSCFRQPAPQEIITKIIDYVREKHSTPLCNALDVGCGPGQSTVVLSPFFEKVIGVDASEAQIQEARISRMRDNVEYLVCPAEELCVKDGSMDLVTCASSLHWFDLQKFLPEVQRVLVPGGAFAAYGSRRILPVDDDPCKTQKLQELTNEVYNFLREPNFLPDQLRLDEFKNVEFPFEDLKRESGIMVDTSCPGAYWAGTVSSFSYYQQVKETNPEKAKYAMDLMKNGILEILGLRTNDFESVPLKCRNELYLILGRKRETD